MNLIEISEKFPDEKDCIEYFEEIRWGDDPECAYCESTNISGKTSDYRYKCYDCEKTFSVTVNTPLHDTRLPLKKWLFAFSVITDAKKGLSAKQLHRNISVSYPTAFSMYHRIRGLMAMETNKPDQLDGIVEIDETYIGGKPRKGAPKGKHNYLKQQERPEMDKKIKELKKKGVTFKRGKGNPAKIAINPKRGRGTDNIPVVGIVERNGDVVAEVMKHVTHQNLKEMVKYYVEENKATLVSDQAVEYKSMERIIDHISVNHKNFYSYKGVNTNSIESFWAIIKRGIMGQYHHVSAQHLPDYIAEFVFKYNNRKEDTMFETLVRNAMGKNETN